MEGKGNIMKYRHLNLKYSLINAFYFMLMCGSAGFANNFLQAKGLETSVIGMILTGVSILALFGQTGMAPIIDRSEKLNEKKFIIFMENMKNLMMKNQSLFG